jgi:methyl acetate hydrolase
MFTRLVAGGFIRPSLRLRLSPRLNSRSQKEDRVAEYGKIDRLLREAVDSGAVPGVIAVAVNDRERLYENASGRRGLSTAEPMMLDSVLYYASMTKALVGAAAMQLVERGRADLDEPISRFLPGLAEPRVLEGYDAAGKTIIRPAKRQITLRHLLTHTSGFGYDIWNANVCRYMAENKIPGVCDSRLVTLEVPLIFDPGERWEYGISIDWVGRFVEAASGQNLEDYLRDNLLEPLGMKDTGFILTPDRRSRLAELHQRDPDGSLRPIDQLMTQEPEYFMGGAGLYGTAGDYAAFIQMMLNEGRASDGIQVLKPETVASMGENSIGELKAGVLKSVIPEASHDLDLFPGMDQKWGLSFLINTEDAPAGRSAGSLTWAGVINSYYWIDGKQKLGGLIMTQILPFADPIVLKLYDEFERALYGVRSARGRKEERAASESI